MDEHRAQANEQLMDELAARVDDLQRRFEGLVRTLRQEEVARKLGLMDVEFKRTEPTDVPMGIRTVKHEAARLKLGARLREEQVVQRLARIPAESFDELVKTITDSNRHSETPTGRRRGRESW